MWPHHMQQEERLHTERIRVNHRWNVHHNWGMRRLDIDSDAFKSGRLVIRHLQARLRDGTVIEVPDEGQLPPIDLKELLTTHDAVTVHLAIAKMHAHRANVAVRGATPGGNGPADSPATEVRYRIEEIEFTDENSGDDAQAISCRSLNLKLLPDSQDLAGYETLPIARFEKDLGANGEPRLDQTYIPPVIACDAWRPLGVDILQATFHQLSSRMANLAEKVVTRGITFETNNAGDNALLGRLAVLNQATAVLNTIAFAEGIHPLTAYLELNRLIGQLAVFSSARSAPKLPAYDHDDLGTCFYRLKRQLDDLDVDLAPYEERAFIGLGLRLQVTMEAKWLEPAWQMFVGVQSPLPQPEIIRLLTKPGQLDMKIGSAERVDQIFERGLKGLEFTHALEPPRVLPTNAGLTYFQVNRDSQKSEWEQVQKSLTLAIRINQSRVVVGPAGNIQGQHVLELKPHGANPATSIQFSLYLVSGDSKTT